jgi:toxin ParE1/3/4
VTVKGQAWRVRLTSAAQNDLREIGNWTAEHFGRVQAETYAETIAEAIAALVDGPAVMGVKERGDIAPGMFSLHVARSKRKGRHFIIFRVGQIENREIIEILRILHDSMDLARHLPPRSQD